MKFIVTRTKSLLRSTQLIMVLLATKLKIPEILRA